VLSVSVLDNITRKVTDTAKAAAKKSGSVVEITKLNLSISAEEEKIRKIYTEMGKQLYEDYIEGKMPGEKLLAQCVKIDEIIKGINEMRDKILELKNIKACPNCGMELDVEMEYCYKCGKKQDEPQPDETSEQADTGNEENLSVKE